MTKAEDAPIFKSKNEVAKVDTSNLTKLDELTLDFDYTPAEITIRHKEEFETAIKLYQEKYTGYIVTAESFEDDKSVRASLRKLSDTANSIVKEKLDDYNKPLEEVKKWVKDLTEPINQIVKDIDDGIKLFDKQEELNRVATVKAAFKDEVEKAEANLDLRIFDAQAESMGLKKYFMADNKRLTKATLDSIAEMVAEEVKKRGAYEKALVSIADAAARANLGTAPYIKHFEQGLDLPDVLELIAKDAKEAEEFLKKEKEKAELEKRIAEMTAIAEKEGLKPDRYVQHLKDGYSALEVHTLLMNDARALAEQNKARESSQESVGARQEQSECNYTTKQENGSETKTEPNNDVVKWQGDFRITFPDLATAKAFGAPGGLYEEAGVIVEKLSEWTKL